MDNTADRDDWGRLGESWANDDPDPESALALREIIANGDTDRIADCFMPALEFGTAGLRAVVGPGPARMNSAVVRRVSRALFEVVQQRSGARRIDQPVVVGFDGRTDSLRFAQDTVGILAAAGVPVAFFDHPVPTPLVAFAAQRLSASAAIVVTASHNPPDYNGYKVYGSDAIQIVPPFDAEVTAALATVGPASGLPFVPQVFDGAHAGTVRLDDAIGGAYVDAVLSSRVRGARAAPIRVAYTPLHGVGSEWVERVFRRAGYAQLHIEPSQRAIDGRFPTVHFPNPEEPGTLMRGLNLAREVSADVLLVNDPDADRMGAALRCRDGSFRILSGNEIGILLTEYILSHAEAPQSSVVASTVVSTPMVKRVTDHHRAHLETTLTGFKWLWTAVRSLETTAHKQFALCWEEALGYSTHSAVRDKDGIAAALVFADWVSECHSGGVDPIDYLAQLYRRYGAWASAPRSVVRPAATGVAEINRMMVHLSNDPPRELAGRRVTNLIDYSHGAAQRPPWFGASQMFIVELEGGARVVVRPSGTEPKLKCYADVEQDVRTGEDPLAAYDRAKSVAGTMNEELVRRLEMVL